MFESLECFSFGCEEALERRIGMKRLWFLIPMLSLAVPVFAAPKNGMEVIPEPGSMATLGVALAGLAVYLRKRR